jgi:acetyl-CoA synthetase
MGKAYPGHRIKIINESGQVLPAGRVGEIAIHQSDPGMFIGYWGDSEATEEKFIGPWMCTQDLAIKDEEGYFWYKGRKDDVITCAGYRIGPTEVEKCIFNHPAVNDVAVVASPDSVRGNIVKAFVRLNPDVGPSQTIQDEIQTLVKENLAAYEYPREIEFVDDFPRTVTGKIQRHILREAEFRKKGSAGDLGE